MTPDPSDAPAIAFFDLDRTILGCNSASLWVRRELRDGYVTRLDAVRAAAWVALYELGFARMEDAIGKAIASLRDQVEDEVRARTTAFWHEEVAPTIRPGARRAVEDHRARGDRIVLLTSSSNYLSELAQEALSLDDILCNRFEVQDGRFTGLPAAPLCFGAGKLVHATAAAERLGTTLDRCAFYTDSMSDLPVLAAVGEPVAVHPDPRLAREARKRGWRIEDWG